MVDITSLSAIVIASITALGSCLVALHIRRIKSGCLECETEEQKLQRELTKRNISPPSSPVKLISSA